MWYNYLFDEMEAAQNDVQAKKMSDYMKNMFTFLGIARPQLATIMNPYLKEAKPLGVDWTFVQICWKKDYREAQYVAIEHLKMFAKRLSASDLPNLKKLIVTKSWWETVDAIDIMVGQIVLNNRELEPKMLEWSTDKNIWVRRAAIGFQQRYKQQTNVELLERIIVNNLGSNGFFINKAIGWSLREFSEINPDWVSSFVTKYGEKMSKLSIREATKNIGR